MIKNFNVYLSDYPTQALKVKAASTQEARQKANNYIKAWAINATIQKIEEGE